MKLTRKDAQEMGLARYFTGRPCERGHLAERETETMRCLACSGVLKLGFSPRRGSRTNRAEFFLLVPAPIHGALIEYAQEAAHMKARPQKALFWAAGTDKIWFDVPADIAAWIYQEALRLNAGLL